MIPPLIAVDPGLRGCGVAVFCARSLSWARYVENPAKSGRGPEAWGAMSRAIHTQVQKNGPLPPFTYFFEIPQVYPGVPETDANDLIDLAGVVGAIVGQEDVHVAWCHPRAWKGQVPKRVMNERVKKKLQAEENSNFFSVGALDHNTWDAVGLGLYYLGRLECR